MADDAPIVFGGGCCCCALLFLFIFLTTSLTTVDQMEMCLKYNWWSNTVDEQTYTEPGIMYKGISNQMICYPNYNQYVYFREGAPENDNSVNREHISVRTEDGLSVDLSMEFVYRLQASNLRAMYLLVGDTGYKHVMVNVAEGALDNAATRFPADIFYQDRATVQEAFKNAVTDSLAGSLFIDVVALQLQPASFPLAYAESITNTQVAMQDGLVALQEQERTRVEKQTELQTAQLLAERALIEADAEALHILAQNVAEVQSFAYRQQREADGYQAALSFFHDVDSGNAVPDFLKYLGALAMSEHLESATSVWLHDSTR